MQTALRTFARTVRVQRGQLATTIPRRFAHQSYGNDQSGHPQGEGQPRRDIEHPGPEAPATKRASSSGSSVQKSSDVSKTGGKSDQGRPAIHQPKSAAEDENPDVKKHNEEMEQRHEKSANQLSEQDNKVDPSYWKGNVGESEKGGNR